MIKATARHAEGLRHEVEVDGHSFVVDEPADAGGGDAGPSPTRLLAASLASCTAVTVQMYAQRKGWDLSGLEVSASFEGTPKAADSARFTVELDLPESLDQEQVGRIRTIAAKCPVHRTLTGTVVITIADRARPG